MKQVAFITDLHLNEPYPLGFEVTPEANLEVILQDLHRRNIGEIIFGGDIGDVSAHALLFERLAPYSLRVIPGNHDHIKDLARHFENYPTPGQPYHSMEDEHFKQLFLDTSADRIDTQQLEWLTEQLQTAKNLILFLHHPVLPVNTTADKLFPLQNRDVLASLLLNQGREVNIFCGHYHMTDERSYQNINQFITLSSSFQLVKDASALEVDNTTFGYRLITLDGNKVSSEVITFPC
ncbi:MAG TPA: metallophosphoesterase [Flavisolibacter sp.]|jgi:3',5'-cyclic AMP phosphodiesterase CpdA|nr:metallophosphoesterase [Flavisolibacter sp.]